MAMEAGDKKSIETNVKQVLQNCTLTSRVNIEKLPVVDIEYYFLQLRARSVGEIVENKYRCDNQIDDGEGGTKTCGNTMESSLNLLDIKVSNTKGISDEIKLTDKISIKLKYPEFSILSKLSELKNVTDVAFEMIAGEMFKKTIKVMQDDDKFVIKLDHVPPTSSCY